jgi:hypothetical protein
MKMLSLLGLSALSCLIAGSVHAQSVAINTFSVIHEGRTNAGELDPETELPSNEPDLSKPDKDKVTIKATFSNPDNLAGYSGKYSLSDGSADPIATGSVSVDSIIRFEHRGKKGTKTYSLSVWMEYSSPSGTVQLNSTSSNATCS